MAAEKLKSFQNRFKIISKSFQNRFKIISKSFQNHFKIVSKSFISFTILLYFLRPFYTVKNIN